MIRGNEPRLRGCNLVFLFSSVHTSDVNNTEHTAFQPQRLIRNARNHKNTEVDRIIECIPRITVYSLHTFRIQFEVNPLTCHKQVVFSSIFLFEMYKNTITFGWLAWFCNSIKILMKLYQKIHWTRTQWCSAWSMNLRWQFNYDKKCWCCV